MKHNLHKYSKSFKCIKIFREGSVLKWCRNKPRCFKIELNWRSWCNLAGTSWKFAGDMMLQTSWITAVCFTQILGKYICCWSLHMFLFHPNRFRQIYRHVQDIMYNLWNRLTIWAYVSSSQSSMPRGYSRRNRPA